VKLVHLAGFITKKFVTMHGHMNVKFVKRRCFGSITLGLNISIHVCGYLS